MSTHRSEQEQHRILLTADSMAAAVALRWASFVGVNINAESLYSASFAAIATATSSRSFIVSSSVMVWCITDTPHVNITGYIPLRLRAHASSGHIYSFVLRWYPSATNTLAYCNMAVCYYLQAAIAAPTTYQHRSALLLLTCTGHRYYSLLNHLPPW